MKRMEVLPRQKHFCHRVVILLIQRQDVKGRRLRVLDHKTEPHNQSQQEKINQRVPEPRRRNISAENRTGPSLYRAVCLLRFHWRAKSRRFFRA